MRVRLNRYGHLFRQRNTAHPLALGLTRPFSMKAGAVHAGLLLFLLGSVLPFTGRCAEPVSADAEKRPLILKKGTIDCDLVETTPIVFKGQLYRFEWVRPGYWNNQLKRGYFRL